MRSVYLDNSATTRVDPAVADRMRNCFLNDYGNPSSIHTSGQKARATVEEARRQVAELIGAQSREIIFTSGGTESDNFAIRGLAFALRERGNHIITTRIEHPAVLQSCEYMQKQGFRVSRVAVGKEGIVDVERLKREIDEQTTLISVMHANNEVGTIQPLKEIVAVARERDIVVHSDGVQSVGKIPVNVRELGVDLLSLSGHKMHGPKGTGALYVRQGTRLEPLFLGGSQERGRRAGTENVPGIAGLGKACELARLNLEDFRIRVGSLRDKLEQAILGQIPDTAVNGCRQSRVPHITNVGFSGIEGEALLIALDLQGVAVSTGSACSSGSLQPSHVLAAMGQAPGLIRGSIRFSLSRMNDDEDVQLAIRIVSETVRRMREMSPVVGRPIRINISTNLKQL